MSNKYCLNFLLLLTFLSACNAAIASSYPSSCYSNGNKMENEIKLIQVNGKKPFYVKCNQVIENGNWTIVLNRFDGSENFNCNWDDCIKGFGNINLEFFIGLQKLHDMTISQLHELMFVMEDFDNDSKIARYNAFSIEDESNAFAINLLGDYSGTAGDSFTYHSGQKFSTIKNDSSQGCPKERMSPGWFKRCSNSNIFGRYLEGHYEYDDITGMYWGKFRGPKYSLKKLAMYIRPVSLQEIKKYSYSVDTRLLS